VSDPKKYAVNPQTGEVAEYNGQSWAPVEKSRVAKSKDGGVAVFNGTDWQTIGARPGASQPPSAWDGISRQLGLTARAGLEGLSAPVGIVGDAANGLANLAISGVNAVAGTDIPKFESYGQYTERALDKVLPKPEGTAEKAANIGAQMMSSAGATAGLAKVGEMAGTKLLAPLGESVIANMTSKTAQKIPTTQAIKGAASAAYKDAEEAGAILRPEAIKRTTAEIQNALAEFGYHPGLQPKVGVILGELDRVSNGNITAKGVDTIRKLAIAVAKSNDPSERTLGGMIIRRLDDMMIDLKPEDVVQGNAEEAVAAITKARGLWKVKVKSELVDDLLERAKRQAARTNSGGNLQNSISQKFSKILDNEKMRRLFDKEEIKAIEEIVNGTITRDTLRTIGRLAPSSNSALGPLLYGMGGAGSYMAGGFPAAAMAIGVPAVGMIAKAGGTALTKGAVNRLSNQVRSNAISRAPQQTTPVDPQQMLIQALMQGTRPPLPNAYADALLRSGAVAVPATGNPNTGPQNRP
jgi:hypothetical protein